MSYLCTSGLLLFRYLLWPLGLVFPGRGVHNGYMNNIKRLTKAEAIKRYDVDKVVYVVVSPEGQHGFYATKAAANRVGQALRTPYEAFPVNPAAWGE